METTHMCDRHILVFSLNPFRLTHLDGRCGAEYGLILDEASRELWGI